MFVTGVAYAMGGSPGGGAGDPPIAYATPVTNIRISPPWLLLVFRKA